MIKVIYGEKGTGKTRILVESSNVMAERNYGHVVFIEDSNQSMYKLIHKVRFINISEFPIYGEDGFIGFICGIISQNYDTKGIFIDGLTYILKKDVNDLEPFFSKLKVIASKFNVEFILSVNGNAENIPGFLKEYIL
ncbi:MAG TPA: hypothetical protein PK733_08630 [Clostridiales bacterium]|nr:hypothetical protein [Clostridiales bacterium]